MRNLIRNVSHSSRCAPLSTVHFAIKPRSPPATTGGTESSGTIASLTASLTPMRQLEHGRDKCASNCRASVSDAELIGERCIHTRRFTALQHVRDEFARVEWREIIQLFAGADEARWDSKFVLDCDDDAAFTAAVELRDNKASQSNGGLEFARLAQRIAACCCIDHEQRFMRRVGVVLGESTFHLFKFGHQILFRVQSPCRIAKQKFSPVFCGRLIRFITKRGWIGVVWPLNHFNAEPCRPNSKLLDCGRAKSIRRGQQDTVAVFLKITRQLRCGCSLARAVDTQEQDDVWFTGGQRPNGSSVCR